MEDPRAEEEADPRRDDPEGMAVLTAVRGTERVIEEEVSFVEDELGGNELWAAARDENW